MTKFFAFISLLIITTCCHAQRITVDQYINQFKEIAINEQIRSGVPAAITLAQGLLETESGNSDLVRKSNNHFGIKCKNTWTGATVYHDDDLQGECFRAYNTPEESFRDHSDFLKASPRYAALFNLDPTNYRGWASGLKKAGYATNPQYPAILIKNIEQYNLEQYTDLALNKPVQMDDLVVDSTVKGNFGIASAGLSKDTAAITTVVAPNDVMTINNCKCVLAGKGTSLLLIASKNNVNLNRLLEFNEMTDDNILGRDQFIYLQRKSKTGDKDYYIVQDGEEVYDVAQKNGIQVQYLLDYNGLKGSDKVAAGTKLFLKPGLKLSNATKVQCTRKLIASTVAPSCTAAYCLA